MKKGESPCREKGRGKNISFRGVNVSRDNRGGHLRLQFADSEGLLSVFSSGFIMQRPRDAALRNKVSLVRSGVRQCREINVKLAAIQVQKRVASLVDRVYRTMSALYRGTRAVSVDIIS